LRKTLHEEEKAIRRLTVWLVGFTIALVVLNVILVILTLALLYKSGA